MLIDTQQVTLFISQADSATLEAISAVLPKSVILAAIGHADTATLDAISAAVTPARAAILQSRDEALPEFVTLAAIDGGQGCEVNKAQAIAWLRAGTHRLPDNAAE